MGARLFKNWWLVVLKGLAFLLMPMVSSYFPSSEFVQPTSLIFLVVVLFSVSSSLVYSLPPRYSIWHFEAVFDVILLLLSILIFLIGEGFFYFISFLGYAILFIFLGKLVVEIRHFLIFISCSFFLLSFLLVFGSIMIATSTQADISLHPHTLQSNIVSIYLTIFPKYSVLFLDVFGICFVYIGIRLKIITSTQQHLLPR